MAEQIVLQTWAIKQSERLYPWKIKFGLCYLSYCLMNSKKTSAVRFDIPILWCIHPPYVPHQTSGRNDSLPCFQSCIPVKLAALSANEEENPLRWT